MHLGDPSQDSADVSIQVNHRSYSFAGNRRLGAVALDLSMHGGLCKKGTAKIPHHLQGERK